MIPIHGVYHWWPKRVGFRNDYCLSCEAPRRAIAMRTFDVGHIFWVPLIPLGFWKHWGCMACRRDPHRNPKTRRSFKWVGVICLVIVSVMLWSVPINEKASILGWLLRWGPLMGAAALLYQLLSTPKTPSLKEHLAGIAAASDVVCPFCGVPLIAGDRCSCPACGVARY